jgi:hypothetical protein
MNGKIALANIDSFDCPLRCLELKDFRNPRPSDAKRMPELVAERCTTFSF